MSTKVTNVASKQASDAQLSPAQQASQVDVSKLGAASATATQGVAMVPGAAAAAAAALLKKKRREDENNDEVAAAEEQADEVASEEAVSEEELLAAAELAEELDQVAAEIDATAEGLSSAANDLSLVFAQAGSTGSGAAAATLGGLNTGTIIGGIAALGVIVAASDSDSSSAASPVTTTPPAPTPSTCAIVATPIALNAFISDPALITVPVLATPAAVASVTTTGESATATGTALTAASFIPTDFSEEAATVRIAYTGTSESQILRIASDVLSSEPGVVASVDITEAGSGYTPGTYSVELEGGSGEGAEAEVVVNDDGEIESITITNGGEGYGPTDSLTFASASWNSNVDVEAEFEVLDRADLDGVEIDGAGGNDTVRLTTDDDVDNLYLSNVEVLQVVADDNVSIDTSTFTGVQELWNWTSVAGNALEFTDVSSTATVIGLRATDASTTVVYDTTVTGSGEVTVVLSRTAAVAELDLDTSGIETGTLNAVRLSSNGTTENNLSLQNTGGDIATITVVGSADLSLSINGTDMAGLATLNAAGLSGDLTIEQQAVGNLDFAIVGGSGSTTVDVELDGDGDLNLTRVQTVNIEVTDSGEVDFAGSSGVGTLVLTDGAADDVALVNMAIGTQIEVDGANLDSLSLDYAQLSDARITLNDDSIITDELSIEGARSVFISTASDVTVGTIAVDTATLVSIESSGNLETGNIENAGDDPFIVRVESDSSSGNVTIEDVSSAGDLYVAVTANGSDGNGDIGVNDITSEAGTVTLNVRAESADVGIVDIVADGTVSILAVTSASKADGGNDVDIGDVDSSVGDIAVQLVAAGTSNGAPANSEISLEDLTTEVGSISVSATIGTNANLDLGNIDSAGTVYVNISADRNSQVTVGDGGGVDINAENGVVLGVTQGMSGATSIGNIESNNGDVALAFSLPSSSNDNDSSVTVGNVEAVDGDIHLHAIDFGAVSVGNTGIVSTAIGIGGRLELGNLTANAEDRTVEIGCEDHIISLARDATFVVNNVSTDTDFTLQHIAFTGTGTNLDFDDIEVASGGVSVELSTAFQDNRVQLGDVDALTTVSVVFASSASEGNLDVGAITTDEGAVVVDVTVSRDGTVSFDAIDSGSSLSVEILSGANSDVSFFTLDSEGPTTVIVSLVNDSSLTIDAIDSGASTTIAVTSGANSDVTLDTTDSENSVSLTLVTGSLASVVVDDVTSSTGNISLNLQISSTATDESTVAIEDLTADTGSVVITGASFFAANSDVSVGDITAEGDLATVSIGSSLDTVLLGVNATFTTGDISADSDIVAFFLTDSGAEVNLGTAAVESTVGGLELEVDGEDKAVSVTVADVTVDRDISITVLGGGTEGNIDLGNLLTREGSISLDLVTGSDGNIDVGTGNADDPGQSITIIATAGGNSDVNIDNLVADDYVSIEIVTSAGGTFDIGTIDVNTGELSSQSGVSLDIELGSSAGQEGNGEVGDIDASSGDVTIVATVSNSGLLELGEIIAEQGSITLGSEATTAIQLGVNSVVETNGAFEAEGDITVFASLSQGANLEFSGNLESFAGEINFRVDADVADAKVVVDGGSGISALGNIEISVVTGTNGNIDFTTSDAIHSLTGSVTIDLTTGRNTTTEDSIVIGGNIEATGTNVLVDEATTISITAAGGSGSQVSISDAAVITADGDVVVDLTLGQGEDGSAAHSLASSGQIISNFGDVELTLRLDSSNSSSDAEATLDIGEIISYNGNVEIVGSPDADPLLGTVVGTNGTMTFEAITAGGDIRVGTETERVWLLFGGDNGSLETLLDFDTFTTSLGDVSAYIELGTGASVDFGAIDAATAFAGSGDVTIDIVTHFWKLADLSSSGSSIVFDDITASGDVSVTILSGEPLMPDVGITTQGSPNITFATVDAASFTLVYEGYAVPGQLDLSGVVDVTGLFDATLSGTANVSVEGHAAASIDIDAGDLDGSLSYTGSAGVGGSIIGGRNVDTLTGDSGNETFVINAVGDEIGDVVDGEGGTDTLQFSVSGAFSFTANAITTVENFELVGGSSLTIWDSSLDDGTTTMDFDGGASLSTIILRAGTYDFSTDSFSNIQFNSVNGGVNLTLANQTTNILSIINLSGSSANTVEAGDGDWYITGGSAADQVTVGDGNGNIELGNGNDVFSSSSAAGLMIVDTGAADDTVTIDGNGGHDIDTGTGADSVTISGGGSNIVELGTGANVITVSGDGSNTITNTSSTSVVTVVLSGDGDNNLTTATGADSITVSGDGDNVITAGTGANSITISGNGGNTVTNGSTGNVAIVTLTVSGDGDNNVTTGSGNDVITVSGEGDNIINAGAGADTISIGGGGRNQITTGSNNDVIQVSMTNYTETDATTAIVITDFTAGGDDLKLGAAGVLASVTVVGTTETYAGNTFISSTTYTSFGDALDDANDLFASTNSQAGGVLTGRTGLEYFIAKSSTTTWLFVDDGALGAEATHAFVFSNGVNLLATDIIA
jgi:hypothetical protein